jgi:hypothetical protein
MHWLSAKTIEISHIAMQFYKQIRRLQFRFKTIKNKILKDKSMDQLCHIYPLKEKGKEV